MKPLRAHKSVISKALAQAFGGIADRPRPVCAVAGEKGDLARVQLPPSKEWQAQLKDPALEYRRFNAQKPYVLVDISSDEPTRGDTHGYIGIAQRLAKRLGAKLCVTDSAALRERYPSMSYYKRYASFFRDEGCPDFYFSRHSMSGAGIVSARGTGVIVNIFNESIYSALRQGFEKGYDQLGYPVRIVPHHLTHEDLAHEGQKFAEEYADLPRPFIGINLIDTDIACLQESITKLASLSRAYDGATFFVVTTHRTNGTHYDDFVRKLKAQLKDTKRCFPVVAFNLNDERRVHGLDLWNPYKGMLDQADHLVQVGQSASMMSEALFLGKSLYVCAPYYAFRRAIDEGFLRSMPDHPAGTPLQTTKTKPLDIVDDCVEELIRKQKDHKAARRTPEVKKAIAKGYGHPHCGAYLCV